MGHWRAAGLGWRVCPAITGLSCVFAGDGRGGVEIRRFDLQVPVQALDTQFGDGVVCYVNLDGDLLEETCSFVLFPPNSFTLE